jgi:predicted small lipoprotein YifL
VALPNRSQAEAIAAPALKALLVLVALVAISGCGDDDTASTPTERDAPTSAEDTRAPDREQLGFERAPRSRRDVEVERNLKRHLKQEAGVASGWTYADVEAVHVRGRRTVVETDLPPRRREAALSLCVAAHRFFLQGGQGQSTSGIIVTGAGRAIIGRC